MSSSALAAVSPYQRLDDYRLEERTAQDSIATVISLHLYGRHADEIPIEQRIRVEGAAFRALRSPQAPWMQDALARAYRALDVAMGEAMGALYAQQTKERRMFLAVIAVQAVVGAFISTLELSNPFQGAGDALRVYDSADAAAREVR